MKRLGVILLLFSTVTLSPTRLLAKPRRVLRIGVVSDVRFIITDPDGRSAGFDRTSGLATTQIPLSSAGETCSHQTPGTTAAKNCYRQFEIANPAPGLYRMQVVAPQAGRFGLYWSDNALGHASGHRYARLPIATGEMQVYDFNVAKDPRNDSVRGDFSGNKAPGAADWLLTWGRPGSESTSLNAGEKSYDAIIIYGPTVIPASFQARLNDQDATKLFHPAPGEIESVRLPLRPGRNVLKLTVDGTIGSRKATDTDTLEFTAP